MTRKLIVLIFCFINIIALSEAKQDLKNFATLTVVENANEVLDPQEPAKTNNSTNSSSANIKEVNSDAQEPEVSNLIDSVFTIHVDEKSDSDNLEFEIIERTQEDGPAKNIEAFVLQVDQQDSNSEAFILTIDQEDDHSTSFEPFVLKISQGSDNIETFVLEINQEHDDNLTGTEPFTLEINQGGKNIEAFILEVNQENDNIEPFVLKIDQGTENTEALVLEINQEGESLVIEPFVLKIDQASDNAEDPELESQTENSLNSTQENIKPNPEKNETDVLNVTNSSEIVVNATNSSEVIVNATNNSEIVANATNNELKVSKSSTSEPSVPENQSSDLVKFPSGILISNSEQYTKNEKLDQQSVETQEEIDNNTPFQSEKIEEKGFLPKH